MKAFIAAAAMSLMLGAPVQAEEKRGEKMVPLSPTVLSAEDVQSVAPALVRFGSEVLIDDLWQRSELSRRDRSIVTVAILIARNQPAELKQYVDVALDNAVTPVEISEIITHLAFYSGWPNAMAAVAVPKDIFAVSAASSWLRHPPSCWRLIRRRKISARPRWSTTSAQFRPGW